MRDKQAEQAAMAREIYLRLVVAKLGDGWGEASIEELEDIRTEAHRAADVWIGQSHLAERVGIVSTFDGKGVGR